MKKHRSSFPNYSRPVLIAISVILLGAIVALGSSPVGKEMIHSTLQSVARIPGLSWVSSWINSANDPNTHQIGDDSVLTNTPFEEFIDGGILIADGPHQGQADSVQKTTNPLTTTLLSGSSSVAPTRTETFPENAATLTPLQNESPTTTSAEMTTLTPTGTEWGTVTPTPTEFPGTRHLSISSAVVQPGEKFQIHLSCDNTEGIAGCDIGLEFRPDLIDLVTVHKTDLTDPFLLVKRKESGTFILSLAGFDGMAAGEGVLLSFEGTASHSLSQAQEAVVIFTKARLYDTESKAFEVRTSNGMIRVQPDPTRVTTQEAQSTFIKEGTSTPAAWPTTHVTERPPESGISTSIPYPYSTPPPLEVGGGYMNGFIPTLSPTVTPFPTRTPMTAVSLSTPQVTPNNLRADLNGDGEVDSRDLMEFMRNWKQVFPSK